MAKSTTKEKQAICKHSHLNRHGYCKSCKLSVEQITPDIAQLEQQKRKAYLEKDKVKLEEVKKMLDYLYYGLK